MNLFRSGTNNGTIDNYTTLVKPQLDQRYLNQQYGQNIQRAANELAHAGGEPPANQPIPTVTRREHSTVLHELRQLL